MPHPPPKCFLPPMSQRSPPLTFTPVLTTPSPPAVINMVPAKGF